MDRLVKIFITISLLFLLTGCLNKTWTYDLPNNYKLECKNNVNTKIINNKDKILDKYIAEFQYSNNYIGLKCVEEETLAVIFYIIDTKNNDIYGPYKDEETYNLVKLRITDNEEFNEFITTTEKPKQAY